MLRSLLMMVMCLRLAAVELDLSSHADLSSVLRNPDKGIFHYYDDGLQNYPSADADIAAVPGLDHLYIRIPWCLIEPKPDQYDWHLIEDLQKIWWPRGVKIALKINVKETSGYRYSTPEWVSQLGAKGAMVVNWGFENWEPDYTDLIFVAHYDDLMRAMAARFDGQPWLSYVDAGSYGDWGEGHTDFSGGQVIPVATVKTHLGFLSHFTTTTRVIGDDWMKWSRSASDEAALVAEANRLGMAFRDDSVLVDWWLKSLPADQYSIDRPAYFQNSCATRPVLLELQHYHMVKADGNWTVPNGATRGADLLRGACKVARASFLGYHGWAADWVAENPAFSKEIANRIGYWYRIDRATLPDLLTPGQSATIAISVSNRGYAPAWKRYAASMTLSDATTTRTIDLPGFDNRGWAPGATTLASSAFVIPADLPPGTYDLRLRLRDASGGTVQLAMNAVRRDASGRYLLGSVACASAGSGWQATYYSSPNHSGTEVRRVDPLVDFNWGSGSPAGGIPVDRFSVRWRGVLTPRYSELYTFSTTSDDGARLWVDGRLIIDRWVNQSAATATR